MSKEEQYWFEKGYDEQCWGYPLLDHVWSRFGEYPKKFKQFYQNGQTKAYEDTKAECPWFHTNYKSKI